MPPRPFPLPFNIGTDIIHVKRIHDILLRAQNRPQHRDRFLRRFLTPGEVLEFQTRFGEVGEDFGVVSRHLAGRWAAKEAAIKAVTWRRLSFHDVVIRKAGTGSSLQAVILDGVSNRVNANVHLSGSSHRDKEALDARTAPADATPPQRHETATAEDIIDPQGQIARISISHDGEYATSVCLAVEEMHEAK